MRIVIDTNVLVSALKSNKGASYALISQLPSAQFQPVLSVPLYSEDQALPSASFLERIRSAG